MSLQPIPKLFILAGLALIISGLLWNFSGGFIKFGRLPGDIRIEHENFRFYFPITTSILISLLVSGLIWLYGRFFSG